MRFGSGGPGFKRRLGTFGGPMPLTGVYSVPSPGLCVGPGFKFNFAYTGLPSGPITASTCVGPCNKDMTQIRHSKSRMF